MFCPRCGTENDSELSYCRSCGQALASVRLALEGRVDQAITTLRNEQRVSVHRVRLAVSALLILAALATLLTGGRFGFANVGSAAILLIISLLFFVHLATKSRRVARLLNPEAESRNLLTNTPASVTEATTLKLNSKDSGRPS